MVNYQTWLSEVDDNTKLSKLSIPGTHNSAACHTALPSVQCQGKSVTEQLKHGVRFLDIRVGKLFVGKDVKDLQVIHGKFPVKIPFPLKLTDALKEVYDFLSENRSEVVIVSIKQEGSDDWDNDNDEFGNLIWDNYIQPNKDTWYLNTDIPRLGDARGKAVLFRRFGVKNQEREQQFGFGASYWSYNTTDEDNGSFAVQDFCEVKTESDLPQKVDYVKEFAKRAQDYTNPQETKLREIIESTNFGKDALKKKQDQIELKKKQEQIELQKKIDEEVRVRKQHDQANVSTLVPPDNKPNKTTSKEDTILLQGINDIIQKEIGNLPSQVEKSRSKVAKKFERFLDSAQDTILTATRALNDVTGYSSIEKLKNSIEKLEEELKQCKENVKICKIAYSEAIQQRAKSQREINELLTRKHSWSPNDLERFTQLYRNDHANEHLESEAERELEEVEQKVDSIQLKLTQSILTRYHEEQIWSDKIRRSSTWGTWILMGINVMLFMVATFFVEPWKRKKLVRAFEEKVKELLTNGAATEAATVATPTSTEDVKEPVEEKQEEVSSEEVSPNPIILDSSINNALNKINHKPGEEADVYLKLKKLEKELELLLLQEEYIKDEQRHLKRELVRAQEEVKRIKSVPLVIGQFLEPIDENTGIVSSTTGSNYVVRILSTLDRELLKPSSSVALHRHSNALVDILPPEADSSISIVGDDQKPDVTYADVGGLDMQKQEIREAVELPLTQGDLYAQIGIDPPRGVLLYGPPGTGKTMLVKAVANSTTASFIRINGSEFVQKYLGEGPRMVRDVFRLARENSPAIIFIDEIDAIATKRFDAQTGADREVQRILLELLNQMDGFDQTSTVKVIMATNRHDTLDPALLRPGRLDRKIEFPSLKDRRERRLIFSTIASKMSLAPEVDLDSLIIRNDPLSGAIIAAIMQEAGLRAVRKNRYMILQSDLEEAYTAQVKTGTEHDKFDFYK
ncbi:26S protease regulatory subunit 6B [Spathaspora sp. JA1]|nr:26S protease regulatory subunit 6B [Spathaspora sp. JA1]